MKRTLSILILALILTSISHLNSQEIVISPLPVNSSSDDFTSPLTLRSNSMYITSDRDGEQNIYLLERNNGTWELIEKLNSDINSGDENGSATLTPDGQYMIFSSYEHSVEGQGRTDLYSARKVNGEWTDVQNLGIAVNSSYWDSQPALSSDGNILLFVSDRPSKNEGTNIFYSRKTREGWTEAKELESANTDADEMSPFIAADNNTITFSSTKSGGYGGFDIYFAKLNNFNVSGIKNAGSKINTENDEHFYVIEANSETAYFSSDKAGGSGNFDIYTAVPNPHKSAEVVMVHGTVNDAITNKPLGSNIIITDIESGEQIANLRSDDISGEYNVVLTAGRNYSVTAEKQGYIFYSENLNVPNEINENQIHRDITLSPIREGKTRLLIFFDFDKSTLQKESYPELQRLVKLMNDNPNLEIALHGHTDDRGTDEYNNKLSSDRANSVKKYLLDSGIADNRIETEGYGKQKPLVNATTEEARAKNRRVEMHITKYTD